MMMYNETVLDHFRSPRNVGEMQDANGKGEVGNAVCGDMMTFYLKIQDDRIVDAKYKTFGCGAAIAVSSIVSEMIIGKHIDEVMQMSHQDVSEKLGGLPPQKEHCSNLGIDAVKKAIEDYLATRDKTPK
jgi:nitrogen fixation protein NifU and related proteins